MTSTVDTKTSLTFIVCMEIKTGFTYSTSIDISTRKTAYQSRTTGSTSCSSASQIISGLTI
jgi:hypothetical protein